MIRFESPSHRTSLLVSQQIDHVLLTAAREEISHEMQAKSLAAKNSAKNDYQWANAELSVVNEWAEELFAAWIETWDAQGWPRCHALYRAIFDRELVILFKTRNACFKAQRRWRALANRSHSNPAIGGWFSREIDKLTSKWNRRMDVESRKCMYAAKREQAAITRPAQIGPASSGLTWQELENRFRGLHSKTIERRASTEFIETEWNSGKVTQEWFLGGNAAWRAEFEALASIATRKLGSPQNDRATDYWLNCIREWMQRRGLDRDKNVAWLATGEVITEPGVTGTTQGFSIDNIAELSAMLCLEMIGRDTPESAIPLHPTIESGPVTADESSKPTNVPKTINNKKPGRPRTRNREFDALAGRLWREELDGAKRVTSDGLKRIAAKLDATDHKKPSDYMEKRAADALRNHNRKNGNAEGKKILSWTHLVDRGDKNQVQAMRDLLSRCGCNTRK